MKGGTIMNYRLYSTEEEINIEEFLEEIFSFSY